MLHGSIFRSSPYEISQYFGTSPFKAEGEKSRREVAPSGRGSRLQGGVRVSRALARGCGGEKSAGKQTRKSDEFTGRRRGAEDRAWEFQPEIYADGTGCFIGI